MIPKDCELVISYCGQNKRECICKTCQTIRFIGSQNYREMQDKLRGLKGHENFVLKFSQKPSYIARFKRQWNELNPNEREAYRERYNRYLNKNKPEVIAQ